MIRLVVSLPNQAVPTAKQAQNPVDQEDLVEMRATVCAAAAEAPRMASHLPQPVLSKIWRGSFVNFSLLLREC